MKHDWLKGILLAALLLAAPMGPAAAAERPDWIDRLPSDSRYLYISAISAPQDNERKAREEAYQAAIQKFIDSLGIVVSTHFKSERTHAGATTTDTLEVTSELARLRGLELVSTYTAPRGAQVTVYALVRIERQAFEAERRRIQQAADSRLGLSEAADHLATGFVGFLEASRVPAGGISLATLDRATRNSTDPVDRAVGKALLTALSRKAASKTTLTLDDRPLSLRSSLQQTPSGDRLVSLLLFQDRQVLWASTEVVIDGVQLPASEAPRASQDSRAAASQAQSRTRVGVLIPEEHLRRRVPDPAGETEVIRLLAEAGYQVVDVRHLLALQDRERGKVSKLTSPAELTRLGAELHVDVLILGEAFSEETEPLFKGVVTSRARLEARAIRCATGEILATQGFEAGASDLSGATSGKKALRQAGHLTGQYLVTALGDRLRQEARAGKRVEVILTGVSYPVFRQWLQELESRFDSPGAVQELPYVDGVGKLVVRMANPDEDSGQILELLTRNRFTVIEKRDARLILRAP